MKPHRLYILPFLLLFALPGLAQQQKDSLSQLNLHFEQAERYAGISLFPEALEELHAARILAQESNNRKGEIDATIRMAELMRKTADFARGLNLIRQLKNTEEFPKLHVQKLSRYAALYAEGHSPWTPELLDTLHGILNQAIGLAMQHGFRHEEALLRNEMGYSQSRNDRDHEGLKNLLLSAQLFREGKDLQNEVEALNNVLDHYVGTHQDQKADSLAEVLLAMVEDKTWYTTKAKLYRIMSMRYYDDKVRFDHWNSRASNEALDHMKYTYTDRMLSFRAIYDTEKFKSEARETALKLREQKLELEKEAAHSRELFFYLIILLLVVLAIGLLFFRERRLKATLNDTVAQLNVANEKYHMLIVESNHRIKNNLQMIISMLQYTSKGLDQSNSKALKMMSGKINTISALHRHLYVDVHNEFVKVETYFNEIIKLYRDIAPLAFQVKLDVGDAQIRSERIVYFGLIFNEMLSNTIEHSPELANQIELEIIEQNGSYLFLYRDGSVREESASIGTGSQLIQQLIRRVGGSDFHFDSNCGEFRFAFAVKALAA